MSLIEDGGPRRVCDPKEMRKRKGRRREKRERESVCVCVCMGVRWLRVSRINGTERWRTQRQTVIGTRGSNGTAEGIRNGRKERLEATAHDGKRKGKWSCVDCLLEGLLLGQAQAMGLYINTRIVSMRVTASTR